MDRVRPYLIPAMWMILVAAPIALDTWSLTQFAQYMTYGIFAMGLAFVWGRVGILSFGQAIFFGIGAYCMALVTSDAVPAVGKSTAVGLLLAALVPALVAYLLGQFLFRGRALGGAYFAVVTLCAAVIAQTLAEQSSFLGGFDGLLGIPPFSAPGRGANEYLTQTETYLVMCFASLVVYLALSYVIRSPVGTILAAIRDNEGRTTFFGYNIVNYKAGAFALSGLVSGLAGALFVRQFGFAGPSLIGFALSTEVLIWVAVGGRNSLLGAFLGALLVRSVEGTLSERLGQYWLLVLGALFVVTVVLMPNGLFGRIFCDVIPRRLRRRKEGHIAEGFLSGHVEGGPLM
jgi:urea transport system permease protein